MAKLVTRVQRATRANIGYPIGGRRSFSKKTATGRRARAELAANVRKRREQKRLRAKRPAAHMSAKHLRGVESVYS
jgi:hypothetical protein